MTQDDPRSDALQSW